MHRIRNCMTKGRHGADGTPVNHRFRTSTSAVKPFMTLGTCPSELGKRVSL